MACRSWSASSKVRVRVRRSVLSPFRRRSGSGIWAPLRWSQPPPPEPGDSSETSGSPAAWSSSRHCYWAASLCSICCRSPGPRSPRAPVASAALGVRSPSALLSASQSGPARLPICTGRRGRARRERQPSGLRRLARPRLRRRPCRGAGPLGHSDRLARPRPALERTVALRDRAAPRLRRTASHRRRLADRGPYVTLQPELAEPQPPPLIAIGQGARPESTAR